MEIYLLRGRCEVILWSPDVILIQFIRPYYFTIKDCILKFILY